MLAIKRIYETPAAAAGLRVLVERLWPRGLTRERAAIDLWLKEVAPSPELRKWFGHYPQKWAEFRERYRTELKAKPELLDQLQAIAAGGSLTLVYAAHDQLHNSAVLLKEFLEESQCS
ncbi:MAG: DUF488 domain-containing protein [Anaerolineales bacterium]